jgi:hypothetical protein
MGRGEQLASGPGKGDAIPPQSGDLSLIDREQSNEGAATREPFVNVAVEGDSLRIDYRNTSNVVVNLYAVDLELLFSKTPFVKEDLAAMAMVEPTHSHQLELDGKEGTRRVKLEEAFARQTLLVEVSSGAARSTALYYGGKLTTYVSQGFGQVQVTDSITKQPVETAYVKVYARHQDGSVTFYKDGYTDLRGRFDFVSLSSGELGTCSAIRLAGDRSRTRGDVAGIGSTDSINAKAKCLRGRPRRCILRIIRQILTRESRFTGHPGVRTLVADLIAIIVCA